MTLFPGAAGDRPRTPRLNWTLTPLTWLYRKSLTTATIDMVASNLYILCVSLCVCVWVNLCIQHFTSSLYKDGPLNGSVQWNGCHTGSLIVIVPFAGYSFFFCAGPKWYFDELSFYPYILHCISHIYTIYPTSQSPTVSLSLYNGIHYVLTANENCNVKTLPTHQIVLLNLVLYTDMRVSVSKTLYADQCSIAGWTM